MNFLESGVSFTDPISVSEALALAKADYGVELDTMISSRHIRALCEQLATGMVRPAEATELLRALPLVPGHNTTYRLDSDQSLWVVGSRYQVVQNLDALDLADFIVGQGEAVTRWAGVFYGGRRMGLSLRLPDIIELTGSGKQLEKWLLFTNSHDGFESIKVIFAGFEPRIRRLHPGPGVKELRIRHTKSAPDRLLQSRQVLGLSRTYFDNLMNALQTMDQAAPGREHVQALAEVAYPDDGPDVDKNRQTMWNDWRFLNAGQDRTFFDLYGLAVGHIETRSTKRSTPSSQFVSHSWGAMAKRKVALFRAAAKMAEEVMGAPVLTPRELSEFMAV